MRLHNGLPLQKTVTQLLTRVDEILTLGKVAKSSARDTGYSRKQVDAAQLAEFRAAALSFIERHFGRDHSHYVGLHQYLKTDFEDEIDAALGLMKAMRAEISGGWLDSVQALISAEVASDYVDMAQSLLDAQYKDAAAVIIGSTLEEHLRQLCRANAIDTFKADGTPKKADALNAELASLPVYTKLDQKQVTAWLGLRNNAAHGIYNQYDQAQVDLMLRGVIDFMTRNQP